MKEVPDSLFVILSHMMEPNDVCVVAEIDSDPIVPRDDFCACDDGYWTTLSCVHTCLGGYQSI